MEKKEFLTPEQRKGLIYGSLISAILSGGSALQSGGNVTEALGRGTMGAAQAYGGGMEEIAKIKHQEIEDAKQEEAISASREATALAKKKSTWDEAEHAQTTKLRGVQTQAAEEALSEKSGNAALIKSYLDNLEANRTLAEEGRRPGYTPPSPESSDILRALGTGAGPALTALVKPQPQGVYVDENGRLVGTPRTQPPPKGVVTPAMAVAEKGLAAKKEEGAATRESRETVSEKGRESHEAIAERGIKAAAERQKETIKADKEKDVAKEKRAEEKEKTKVYWDETEQKPVTLKVGKEDPETQWDPDKSRIAKRKIEGFRRSVTPAKPGTTPAEKRALPKF